MKVTPMHNNIFVLKDKIVDTTESGIILSEFSRKRPSSGTVLAIGPKVQDVKVGDRVIHGEFSGAKELMQWNGQEVEVHLMSEYDIIAIIENEVK